VSGVNTVQFGTVLDVWDVAVLKKNERCVKTKPPRV
jgi:hypothetical protein